MMDVSGSVFTPCRRIIGWALFALAAFVGARVELRAQTANPTSAQNPFFGSVTAHPLTDDTVRLSLDDAVRMGLENNLGLKESENAEKAIRGEESIALQEFLPTITLSGGTGVFQHDLAAQGFGPGVLKHFGSLFPGGVLPPGVSLITRDDLTQGQINFSQTLFSGPVIAGWRAANATVRSFHFAKETARGNVVQAVATAYLRAIAAGSEVDDAVAQETADKVLSDQAHEAHAAGTASNLDELRARVQLQAQQQARIAAENAHEKDLILLKREIGIDPGQKIELTDPAPYGDLADETEQELLATAYKSRQDYQNLQNQLVEFRAVHAAYRSQRLPKLSFNGFWGVDTVNGAGTHGNFVAAGTLSVPIFKEASLRGDEDAAQAQLANVHAQLDDLQVRIHQQVLDAMLDVTASQKLVDVARSNVALATQGLADETSRVQAGVDDNLPLVQAQATMASSQTNLVESIYQYNVAKLALARATGVIETEYRQYLGR